MWVGELIDILYLTVLTLICKVTSLSSLTPPLPHRYTLCIHQVLRGLEDGRAGEHLPAVPRNIGRDERLHMTLLLLSALLKHANAAWEATAAALRHITHYHSTLPKKVSNYCLKR